MIRLRYLPWFALLACEAPAPTTLLLQGVPAEARRADLLFLRDDASHLNHSVDIPMELASRKRELSLFLELPAGGALRAHAQLYDPNQCLIAQGSGALQDRTLPIPLTAVAGCPNGGKLDPVLQKVTPAQAAAEDGATLTLEGLNFQPGAQVLLNDQPRTGVEFTSTSLIKAQAPKSPGALGKAMRVTVVNPDGQRSERADLFRYYERHVRFEQLGETLLGLQSGGPSMGSLILSTVDLDGDGLPELLGNPLNLATSGYPNQLPTPRDLGLIQGGSPADEL